MPFYASTWAAAAVDGWTTFTPTAVGSYAGEWRLVLDMRPDVTVTTGRCLVWTATALASIPTGVTLVASSADGALTTPVRNWFSTNFGITIPSGTTLRAAVRRLLTSDAAGRWPALQARAGSYRAMLGDVADEWIA